MTLSILLIFLIPTSEVVPGRAGEGGRGLRGQGRLPGKDGGLGDSAVGQGHPKAEAWRLDQSACLENTLLFPFRLPQAKQL